VPLTTLVRVAGRAVEEDSQTGKELTALDQHQVRRWTSCYRRATPALLAHAFLTAIAAVEHARAPRRPTSPSPCFHRSRLCAIGCAAPRRPDATNTAPRQPANRQAREP
jgi:hypothetical protein